MPQCTALKGTGDRCTAAARQNLELCGQHNNSQQTKGPNAWAVAQLNIAQKRVKKNFQNQTEETFAILANRQRMGEISNNELLIYNTQRAALKRVMNASHIMAVTELVNAQLREIERTGINPDQAVIDRQAEVRQRQELWFREQQRLREEERIMRQREFNEERRGQMAEADRDAGILLQNIIARELADIRLAVPAGRAGGLAGFVADPQNIHTTATVQMTTTNIKILLDIPVPAEYKWNRQTVSMTPFEIGMKCKLTHQATGEMMARYMSEDRVYDLCHGTYGRAMDGMWQFVKKSDDAESLYKIIKREMEDNVGMCAQGNLSRICNILAGYLEGIGAEKESIATILGRLLPPLMDVADVDERRRQARAIMSVHDVDDMTQGTWLEALEA